MSFFSGILGGWRNRALDGRCAFALTSAIASACSHPVSRAQAPTATASTSPASAAPNAPPPTDSLPALTPERDGSLEIPAYVAAGVPDPGQPWGQDELERAVRSLIASARSGRQTLPRRASVRSSVLFARLITPTTAIADPPAAVAGLASAAATGPAEANARELGALSALCGLYAPGSDKLDLSAEQVALVGALLQRLDAALDSSATRARSDVGWRTTYEQQQSMLAAVFRGVLQMLGETDRYTPGQRAELRHGLETQHTALAQHLPADERAALEDAALEDAALEDAALEDAAREDKRSAH